METDEYLYFYVHILTLPYTKKLFTSLTFYNLFLIISTLSRSTNQAEYLNFCCAGNNCYQIVVLYYLLLLSMYYNILLSIVFVSYISIALRIEFFLLLHAIFACYLYLRFGKISTILLILCHYWMITQ